MRYLVSGKEMKEIDRRSIVDYGIPSLVLMERAALAVVEEIENRYPGCHRIWAVCGLGNNGADGVAAARMLSLRGYEVRILLPTPERRMSEEMCVQLGIVKKLGIPVCSIGDRAALDAADPCDLVIDAVFGIGLTRPVEGVFGDLVQWMMERKRTYGAKIVAVDIPSGISSETGAVMGCAVEADVTVTFGEQKLGQALFPGRELCGTLIVAQIGFVPEEPEAAAQHILAHTKEDLALVPKRRTYSHKGTYGKILVIAGSRTMSGAAYFAAKAAYRTGAGLVKVMTVEENRPILQERLPEAILATYDVDRIMQEPDAFRDFVQTQVEWADAIVLGPGLGMEEYGRGLVETVLGDAYVPIIMDADAINLAARYPYLKNYFTENIILTPHLSECSRLIGKSVDEIREDLVGTAKAISGQYGGTCVLKDAATVTARKDGRVYINTSGSPAMAKGGSGDVLCGVIAGLLGLGMEEAEAASLGVYIHGLAGEAAAERYGVHSVLAGELADAVGTVLSGNL